MIDVKDCSDVISITLSVGVAGGFAALFAAIDFVIMDLDCCPVVNNDDPVNELAEKRYPPLIIDFFNVCRQSISMGK